METNRKYIILSAITALAILLSSCGRAGFDATIKPADVKDIDLSLLNGPSYLVIKKQAYIDTGIFGINLSKLTYKYTFKNTGDKSLNIQVRLSLFGDDNMVASIHSDANADGYIDDEENWLTSVYRDTGNYSIPDSGYGWVSMIGTPSSPLLIPAGGTVTESIEINNSAVVNQILKQKGIWIDIYVSPTVTISYSGSLDLINQSIEVEGSKTTGYFPGVF